MEHALCYVARVLKIRPIQNADNVCLAYINGWQCVIKIDEFREGDLAIYYSIDSIPDFSDPNTELVRSRGGRVKTIKLRGVVSQGLLAPLSWLESRGYDISNIQEGEDVTDRMGVTKYISSEEIDQYVPAGHSWRDDVTRAPFPVSIPKSEEVRLQNKPYLLDYLRDRTVVVTRKEDGCSATFVFENGIFRVCGRNFEWLIPTCTSRVYHLIADKYAIEEKMRALGKNIALQGEVVGPKINSNRHRLAELTFRVFNIWDLDTSMYLLWEDVECLCQSIGVDTVPVVFRGPATGLPLSVEGLLGLAGDQRYEGQGLAEGIVVKSNDDGKRLSFKVISNKYLLKHNL